MKNCLLFFSLALGLGTFPVTASADTLQLQSVGGTSVNGVSIYPYNFSLNGSSALTSMMCLDFNREITLGEKWQVAGSSILLDGSQLSTEYRALAIIDYAISTGGQGYSLADLQFADWAVFDPTDMASNSGFTSTAATIKSGALQMANNSSITNSGFYSNFTLYSPTSDTTGWTQGIPQEFLAYQPAAQAVSVTPEPSALVLLGTGVLSMGGLVRRKLRARPLSTV